MLQSIEEHTAKGDSFALETTLSGLHYARAIPIWCESGYVVKLIFLELPNAETAIAPVAARVAQGAIIFPTKPYVAVLNPDDAIFTKLTKPWLMSGCISIMLAIKRNYWTGANHEYPTVKSSQRLNRPGFLGGSNL